MPTQEERLTNLERFQRETIQAVHDTNMNITALLVTVRAQGQDIKRIATTLDEHTDLLKQILARLPAPGKE